MRFSALLFVACSLALCYGSSLQNTIDLKRLQNILQEGLKSKDLNTLYHAAKGLALLKVEPQDICEDIKTLKYDVKNVEQVFYLTNAAMYTLCQNSLNPEVLSAATQTLDKTDATIPEIYYAVYILKALGKGSIYDAQDALKNLILLLKKDDTPTNYGYVFALCEHMGCQDWTTNHAESVLLAADETDSKLLHFEGGLPITALLLSTISRSYKLLKKPLPLSDEQRYKFSEYLLSRRSVTTPRGAALLLEAALALADDERPPISISIKGKRFVTSESDAIEVSITDFIGRPVPGLKPDEVLAQSGTRLSDDVVVLSKQPLIPKPNDPSIFVLNLSKIKSQYGVYKIALSAGSKTASVNVAVLGDIQVNSVEIGVGDVDGTTSPKITTVAYPNKLAEKLQADHLQKLSLKLTVRDKWNKAVSVQQAFVRVASASHEAIFVAEHDSAKAYKVELNVASVGKHLNYESGPYSLTIYLGDSAVSTPIEWQLGEVLFNFGKDVVGAGTRAARGGPRPEIAHSFRAAEARPARLVSDVFAAACGAPLLLLLALWAAAGANLAAAPAHLAAPLFHLALGGSLALYVVLWLQLSMFETARYLAPLALLTFLAGHRLLRRLARDKLAR